MYTCGRNIEPTSAATALPNPPPRAPLRRGRGAVVLSSPPSRAPLYRDRTAVARFQARDDFTGAWRTIFLDDVRRSFFLGGVRLPTKIFHCIAKDFALFHIVHG
ncbi:hypothetical protein MUK42_14216 [Musa troglodytarum]|uniref:Uncharacterized protein n=1 Tax=Musa troglodytarum TaxID=320322 RepID=A0A9E7L857_9LILI|nr:hypothetical protein MUK42_14216 [Musa troglodytarum]